jgi:hypothetical protein
LALSLPGARSTHRERFQGDAFIDANMIERRVFENIQRLQLNRTAIISAHGPTL